MAPRKGRRQALRVISDLLAFEPAAPDTDLGAALGYLEPMLRRRAVIFLLSDFLATGLRGGARPAGATARPDRDPGAWTRASASCPMSGS